MCLALINHSSASTVEIHGGESVGGGLGSVYLELRASCFFFSLVSANTSDMQIFSFCFLLRMCCQYLLCYTIIPWTIVSVRDLLGPKDNLPMYSDVNGLFWTLYSMYEYVRALQNSCICTRLRFLHCIA